MRERMRRHAVRASLLAVVGALAIAAAGCGGDDEGSSTSIEGLGSSLEEIQEMARLKAGISRAPGC